MQERPRCQSCGMALGAAGFYGSNFDGTDNLEYCKLCFQNGSYTEPALTVEVMIDRSIQFMVYEYGCEEFEAEVMSKAVISKLKRWQ